MYLSGVDQFRSSEDAASMPNSPSYMNCTNGGTLHEGMFLDNPTQNEVAEMTWYGKIRSQTTADERIPVDTYWQMSGKETHPSAFAMF